MEIVEVSKKERDREDSMIECSTLSMSSAIVIDSTTLLTTVVVVDEVEGISLVVRLSRSESIGGGDNVEVMEWVWELVSISISLSCSGVVDEMLDEVVVVVADAAVELSSTLSLNLSSSSSCGFVFSVNFMEWNFI